jgi:Zn-dependent peptidase ImmA (M78 family)/DNA-binding XRE family transcriptional regulator
MTSRLKQLRLARGLSLEDLAASMGGIVSRQAIHQYEQGTSTPSPSVLNQLAKALGAKAISLQSEPKLTVKFIAYRSRASIGVKEQEAVQALMALELEKRAELQSRCCLDIEVNLPVESLPANNPIEAENAAIDLREKWRLGLAPIADLTALLEDHMVHVIGLKTSEKFDGLSGYVCDGDKAVAAGVSYRQGSPGDRQRLSLAHELGHLMLKIDPNLEEKKQEEFAFRFAGAFLLPSECVYREIGKKRTSLRAEELLLLKKRFKVSVQAILRRLLDLSVISPSAYKTSCILISKMGWRKNEPMAIPPESDWARQVALRGLSEGQLTVGDVERLGIKIDIETIDSSSSLLRKSHFRELPIEERRKLLREQSEKLAAYYKTPSEWNVLDGEEFDES